jgi:hypothetical protein
MSRSRFSLTYSFGGLNPSSSEEGCRILISITLFPLISFVLLGCQCNNEKTAQTIIEAIDTTVSNPLKIDKEVVLNLKEDNGVIQKEKGESIIPDTTINNKIILENYGSLSTFYTTKRPLSIVERLRESPVIIFRNESDREYLLVYQYEGNTENAFSCFEIGYVEDDEIISLEKSNQTQETYFQTESGLRLGLSLEDVTQIKGREYVKQKSGDFTVLRYKIDDYENSNFLKKFNFPEYFIEIKLRNNIVTNLKFGFSYP